MNVDAYGIRMPSNHSEMNTDELEYDGGVSTLGWACLGVALAVAVIGIGVAMYALSVQADVIVWGGAA